MKIRSGFVSNSSSSSFIVLASQKTIDEAKSKLSKFGQDVVDEVILGNLKNVTLEGNKFKMAQGMYSTEEFAMEACSKHAKNEEEEYDLAEKAMDEWARFKDNINKLGGLAS